MHRSALHILISIFLLFLTISGTDKNTLEKDPLYSKEDRILVVAHRGSHKYFPENSLGAIKKSIENNIDIIEIDIRETKDQIPVLLHDDDLKRTTGFHLRISELNFIDLAAYPLLFKGQPTDFTIPSLEEALKSIKGKAVLNLDFKLNDLDAIKRSYKLIENYQMEGSVILSLRDYELFPELYELNPNIRIMPVAFSNRKIKNVIKNDNLDVVQVYHRNYNKRILNELHSRNIEIWVNAMKKYDKLEKMHKNGFEKLINIKKVNFIQTDYPEDLLAFLQKKGLHD